MQVLRQEKGTGLDSKPRFYELEDLHVNMKNQTIKIAFNVYTEIAGEKVFNKSHQYIVKDGTARRDINGNILGEKDENGDVILINGEPKPALSEFTKLITAFTPSLWEGVMKAGIEAFMGF